MLASILALCGLFSKRCCERLTVYLGDGRVIELDWIGEFYRRCRKDSKMMSERGYHHRSRSST